MPCLGFAICFTLHVGLLQLLATGFVAPVSRLLLVYMLWLTAQEPSLADVHILSLDQTSGTIYLPISRLTDSHAAFGHTLKTLLFNTALIPSFDICKLHG